MKTVPSLIASSTVGVAAAGLALARPDPSTPPRPTSKKRKVGEFVGVNGTFPPPSSRPATSSTVTTSEARQFLPPLGSSPAAFSPFEVSPRSNPRFDTLNSSRSRRLSLVRNGDFSSLRNSTGDEPRRDSVSSRGSWIRRLSTMPMSQSNSPRSSVGPDSPSVQMSHGSAAPILSNPSDGQPQLPPNKLVKRSTSGRVANGSISRSGSRSQVPTLRRPATSHQRSITLQQRFREESTGSDDRIPETPPELVHFTPFNKFSSPESRTMWRPFFESRPTKLAKERPSGRPSDIGSQGVYSTSRRVLPNEMVKPTLVKPSMITVSKSSSALYYEEDSLPIEDIMDDEAEAVDEIYVPSTAPHSAEPQKRPRRSLSMHFGSPGSWIARSGSLRASKGSPDGKSGGKRYSSAPVVSTLPGRKTISSGAPIHGHRSITDPTIFQNQASIETPPPLPDPFPVLSFQARSRNTSSPLPPLSRLSSFNIDLARLGLSSSSSSQPRRSPSSHAPQSNTTSTSSSSQVAMSPSLPPYYGALNTKPNRMSEAVTLVGSEIDAKGFASGEEDDVDFQSETVFDSLRSGATGSMRSHNTPLDSMFDESPPSATGSKGKRLSIHELMATGTFQEGSKIVEEDEDLSTPVKTSHSSQEKDAELETPGRKRVADHDAFPSSSSFSLAAKDFGRLSLDDEDDDEDWTRDDENSDLQQLSPPSIQLTARRISPSLRAALADVTHTSTANTNPPSAERPKSNLFDWSEPSSAEKLDHLGNSPRPRTAHAKQAADGRGGRTMGRRGPTALHIRSQSVPVVPDVAGQRENSKLAPKFGTWGLGGKGASEEWDGDFEFEDDGAADPDADIEGSSMLVPPAIQASQENVVGHVGQIREVCLLVEDLKRLRLLAREKDLLVGPSAPLWKEAEGIIALAVPDEEDPTLSPSLSPTHSPTSVVFGSEVVDGGLVDQGPDAEDIERPEAPLEVLNRHGRPTGFVYDGNTVRRRSVFVPDDEIFGTGPSLSPPANREYLHPPSNSPRPSSMKNSSEYARSVMQNMHQTRSTSDPLLSELTHQSLNKMPFDTTSLRDLVHRASVLRSKLSDIIRKSDGSFQISDTTPKHGSSPAFTRVFTDPVANPPKSPGRSHGNNSILGSSIDASPSRSLGQQHMHMMTVV